MDLVEHGIDLAVRMGRLADSSLGARYLGSNPWVVVASPDYLRMRGMLRNPVDLDGHDALVYSSVQGDARWHFSGKYDAGTGDSTDPGDSSRSGIEDGPVGAQPAQHLSVLVKGPLRSNNLSALLAAARAGLGVAALPCYVAQDSISAGAVQPVLTQWSLPTQEVHAVFPSPRHVPAKVQVLIDHLKQGLQAHPAFDT
jgi:DNA-binding transcriptional LysR family regulator